MDSRTNLRDLRVAAIGAGEAGSLPRRPRFVRRFGTPLLLLLTLLLGIGAVSSVEDGSRWVPRVVAFAAVVPLALIVFRPLLAWRLVAVVALLSEFATDPRFLKVG